VEALAWALMRSHLFDDLPHDRFVRFLGAVTEVTLRRGDLAVREGDPADAFYVLVDGALDAFTTDPDGAEIPLATLSPGAHFGEQALLSGVAGRRTASLRCATDRAALARLATDGLAQLLADAPALRAHLEDLGRRQLEERLSRRSDMVRDLLAREIAGRTEITLKDGDALYRQGDPVDAVFIVLSGAVDLWADRDGAPVHAGRLGAGLAVGERDEARRSTSAIAQGPTRALRVPQAAITGLGREARGLLATMERVWSLPQRGFVRQYLGEVDGVPCVSQLFHLVDGRSLASSHVVGTDLVRLRVTDATADRTLTAPDGTRVSLSADGHVAAVDADAHGDLLRALYARAMEGRPLSAQDEREITRAGALAEDDAPGFACACLRVERAAVRDAIRAGAGTLDALRGATGCGLACGSCVPGLLEMLGVRSFRPVRVARITRPTPRTARITLAPEDGAEALPPALPGQHVVLRATIDGARIERPYTLSEAAEGPWEVTVQREPDGQLSPHLVDALRDGDRLEASAPGGDVIWGRGPDPVVCFVSGIGLTPALCFARTLVRDGLPHHLVVDWSTRDPADLALLGELHRGGPPNLTLRARITSREPRLNAEDVAAIARRLPSAWFFLCGGDAYRSAVEGWLRAAGVPASRVQVESFDPATVTGPA
jgi:ferredoxin-NADP reductase/CRP-like cAMP-binding protein